MNRHMIVGVFGPHVIHSPVHDAALNEESTALGIEVAHCKPVISLTRSPRHCATTIIGRYSSGKLARTAWNASLVRIIGRLRRLVEF